MIALSKRLCNALKDARATICELFPDPVRFNERLVLLGDGIKIARQGHLMPAVKLLHQSSDSNTNSEYIMSRSHQAMSLPVNGGSSAFTVPSVSRIHEGAVTFSRDTRTQHDKMISLLQSIDASAENEVVHPSTAIGYR